MYRLTVIGNLGADATVKNLKEDVMCYSFAIASSQKYTNKEGLKEEKTYWVQCSYFIKKVNTKFLEQLTKGSKVYVEGKPNAYSYTKDGSTVVAMAMDIDKLEFC